MQLTEQQLDRYKRHIMLQGVGIEGQQKIMDGRILIIGAGGLGSAVSLYLAAAGVGTIGIADADVVDITNLQRQVIHYTQDLDKPKVISAKEKINKLNPDVYVNTIYERVTAENIQNHIENYDFVIDASDNFTTKFLINDACVLSEKAFSHGGVLRFDGQTMSYIPGNACYRCLFNGPPPDEVANACSQAGILGAIAGMLGTIQAAEALKFLTGAGEMIVNRLLVFDALSMHFRNVIVKKNDSCPVCGKHPNITILHY